MASPPASGSRAVVLGDGDAPTRELLDSAWPGWDAGVTLVVAADGGARHAPGLGLSIDAWIGDGDSIDPGELARLERAGVPVRRVPGDKDESDTELAVDLALELGAGGVVLLGALGGPRVDHALANLGLLLSPDLAPRGTTIYDARGSRVSLLAAPGPGGGPARGKYAGRPGDLVSLLPFGVEARGVRTTGLRYALHGEPLPVGRARGLSNVRTAPVATVSLDEGRLLVVESPGPASLRP